MNCEIELCISFENKPTPNPTIVAAPSNNCSPAVPIPSPNFVRIIPALPNIFSYHGDALYSSIAVCFAVISCIISSIVFVTCTGISGNVAVSIHKYPFDAFAISDKADEKPCAVSETWFVAFFNVSKDSFTLSSSYTNLAI